MVAVLVCPHGPHAPASWPWARSVLSLPLLVIVLPLHPGRGLRPVMAVLVRPPSRASRPWAPSFPGRRLSRTTPWVLLVAFLSSWLCFSGSSSVVPGPSGRPPVSCLIFLLHSVTFGLFNPLFCGSYNASTAHCAGRHFRTKLMSQYIGFGQKDRFDVRIQELFSKVQNSWGFLQTKVCV